MTTSLDDLATKAAAGEAFSREEAERVLTSPDLITAGTLGETARKHRHGNRVMFGRVLEIRDGILPADRGQAGEIRVIGRPESVETMRELVRSAVKLAGGVPVTAFSVADLIEFVAFDEVGLADLARRLHADGLDGVAEVPIDKLDNSEMAPEIIRAVLHGGLKARRATITQASAADRLDLIERAAALQRETGAFVAFAPLPRVDPREQPSTGYDDVRTITVARLMCPHIPAIQVDWPLYGPKLAQVAIAYGADDLDGISPLDTLDLGPRRAPREEILRHIRMASAEPAERDGRYTLKS